MKGAEGITCLDMHESFIMSGQDSKLCSVHPFTAPAFPVMRTVLLFGSVWKIAINLRIKATNGSAYFNDDRKFSFGLEGYIHM